jgi:hypothetical protein
MYKVMSVYPSVNETIIRNLTFTRQLFFLRPKQACKLIIRVTQADALPSTLQFE